MLLCVESAVIVVWIVVLSVPTVVTISDVVPVSSSLMVTIDVPGVAVGSVAGASVAAGGVVDEVAGDDGAIVGVTVVAGAVDDAVGAAVGAGVVVGVLPEDEPVPLPEGELGILPGLEIGDSLGSVPGAVLGLVSGSVVGSVPGAVVGSVPGAVVGSVSGGGVGGGISLSKIKVIPCTPAACLVGDKNTNNNGCIIFCDFQINCRSYPILPS